ncbi:MAG: sigma-54 factor interaction domain-containing protein, partial [Bacteroidales bacterium]|nr:sigma-54 factor interaction domain-containing protein [Bacteroidales bacterium]
MVVSKDFFEKAKDETISNQAYTGIKKGKYLNPLLNLINPENEIIDLSRRYIGNSEPCMLVRQMITVAAKNDYPVLILGESGTGKEVTARAIHEYSSRKENSFIAINCGAISQELFEPEIFGYKKGSFTGAVRDKKGLWELANGGTLFLDEIGDLLPGHQVKILKAIEDGMIYAVGSTEPLKTDVRIIAATNKSIEDLYNEKK